MKLCIGLKSGERFVLPVKERDFDVIVKDIYKNDVELFNDVAIRVSEIEFIVDYDKFVEVIENE